MSSFRRVISSRANAQHSTGPKTEAGKRRSSRNALRHGCRSRQPGVVLLENESRPDFDALLQEHVSDLQPRTSVERVCVDRMVAAVWRQRRLWARENSMWNEVIASPSPTSQVDDNSRLVAAFSTLCQEPGFAALSRYEDSCHNTYDRSLHQLLALQRQNPHIEDPHIEICTNEATLCIPYASPGPQAFPCRPAPNACGDNLNNQRIANTGTPRRCRGRLQPRDPGQRPPLSRDREAP